jgi:hypothetical protein
MVGSKSDPHPAYDDGVKRDIAEPEDEEETPASLALQPMSHQVTVASNPAAP